MVSRATVRTRLLSSRRTVPGLSRPTTPRPTVSSRATTSPSTRRREPTRPSRPAPVSRPRRTPSSTAGTRAPSSRGRTHLPVAELTHSLTPVRTLIPTRPARAVRLTEASTAPTPNTALTSKDSTEPVVNRVGPGVKTTADLATGGAALPPPWTDVNCVVIRRTDITGLPTAVSYVIFSGLPRRALDAQSVARV